MIFVDSNIPMYLIGSEHPHKRLCSAVLEELVGQQERFVTNTEVFQEIMHRYTALHRQDAIQPAFDILHTLVDTVFPVTIEIIEKAKDVLLAYQRLSARDALHVATLRLHEIPRILSFDRGFDQLPRIERLPHI